MDTLAQLGPQLKHLRLSGLLDSLEVRTRQAIEERLSYPEFLARLLEDEVERRAHAPAHPGLRPGAWAKQLQLRLRRATFHGDKTLEGFDFNCPCPGLWPGGPVRQSGDQSHPDL